MWCNNRPDHAVHSDPVFSVQLWYRYPDSVQVCLASFDISCIDEEFGGHRGYMLHQKNPFSRYPPFSWLMHEGQYLLALRRVGEGKKARAGRRERSETDERSARTDAVAWKAAFVHWSPMSFSELCSVALSGRYWICLFFWGFFYPASQALHDGRSSNATLDNSYLWPNVRNNPTSRACVCRINSWHGFSHCALFNGECVCVCAFRRVTHCLCVLVL